MPLRFASFTLVALVAACGTRTEPRIHASRRPVDAGRPGIDAEPVDGGDRDGGGIEYPDGAMPDPTACPAPCEDDRFCNGVEYCEATVAACQPGLPIRCDDGDECTVDVCDRRADSCVFTPVDRDDDGDGVSACDGDCADADPLVFPGAREVCDGADQDCDGEVDEGVRSECGDCRPCFRTTVPDETGGGWDPDEDRAEGVEVDGGDLVLATTRSELAYAWIANTQFGTITKLDTRNGAQVAEYDSVIRDGTNDARPPGEECNEDGAGNCPSRTAVDLRGAVFVANRAFGRQGTVTKIAGLEEDCVDRDGDGRIDTSRDVNGNGVIDRDVRGEFLGQDDECIVWTRNVGSSDGVPRGIAIAADGTVWVGLHNEQRVLQLDADDGEVLTSINVGGSIRRFRPYGAAIDGEGRLWFVEAASGRILEIDVETGRVGRLRTGETRDGCSGSYGIAIDAESRVWLAGFQCPSALRYDPASDRWRDFPLPDSGATRGIIADDLGNVYVAASHTFITIGVGGFTVGDPITRVTRFSGEDGSGVTVFGTEADPLPGLGSVGVGLDNDRRVWLVNQVSGSATRLDPVTGAVREFPVGTTPYTYSDFTGFALRTFTAPNGTYRQVIQGCPAGPTQWERVTWNAETPRRSRVEVRMRTARTRDLLTGATWVGPFTESPSDLELPPGPLTALGWLELEVSLIADEERSPRLMDVTVQHSCL